MQELITNIHIHTRYSDGRKLHREIAEDAIKAGLDAIIITDHNMYVKGFDGYTNINGQRVLVIVGEEIHDKNRTPQKNHLLALGINRSHTRYANSPQELINSIKQAGALSFIAHPYDPELRAFKEDDLSWEDWTISGFTGLEIWNNLSEFKVRVKGIPSAVFFGLFPEFLAKEPPVQILRRWDALLSRGKKAVAIGGSDAHTLKYNFGPFRKTVFPYSYHFKTINTHVMINNELTGDAKEDTAMIIDALGKGHAYVANDMLSSGKGFRFNLEKSGEKWMMGDEVDLREGQILTATLPAEAECVLLRDGEPVYKNLKCRQVTFPVKTRGCYRLECYRRFLFERRGWLFSNPIYIR